MPLPAPPTPQSLAALKSNTPVYETFTKIIEHQGLLIQALSPGELISAAAFSNSYGVNVSAVSGTFKRGRVTFRIADSVQNPTMFMAFPAGLFTSDPFAQVTRNGGTGSLLYSYVESTGGIRISLAGTAVTGTTYTFNWAVQS
jgi:hypothetical protein